MLHRALRNVITDTSSLSEATRGLARSLRGGGSMKLLSVPHSVESLWRWPEQRRRFRIGLFLVASLCLWGFIEVAEEVAENDLRDVEAKIMYAMREPGDLADPVGPIWLEEAARDVTALGSLAILAFVVGAVVLYLYLIGKGRVATYVLCAVLSGVLLSTLLKSGFDRARPDLIAHQMHTLTKSFPSGHSLLSAVVYLSLGALVATTQPPMRVKVFVLFCSVMVTVAVGLSRVYLGVHWPTDVLGGWFVGASWALGWWLVALVRLPKYERDGSEVSGVR